MIEPKTQLRKTEQDKKIFNFPNMLDTFSSKPLLQSSESKSVFSNAQKTP